MSNYKEYDPKIPENSWGVKNPIEELTQWLIDNPEFDDRPATMLEFMGPEYLNIDAEQNPDLPKTGVIRPGVKQALIDIFGDGVDPKSISEKREAMFTGGIGVGKTTLASVALAYCVHWVMCLHDPQQYFGLMPGSRIAFMLMSTKDSQAKEVLFGDIKARINHSKWFQNLAHPDWRQNSSYDPALKNQLRFPKDVWVIPGNSAETTFEGYNILGGILDEGDSHKVTENKDYADVGYRTIKARISSRFSNKITGKHRGLLIVIGQMKKADGFMARKKKAMEKMARKDNSAKVVHMTIWDSEGWDAYVDPATGKAKAFYYDTTRKIIVPDPAAKALGNSPNIIRIPMAYFDDFELDPIQALKDHAGIPPAVEDPFITAVDRITEAQKKWKERFKERFGPGYTPALSKRGRSKPEFHELLFADNTLKRTLHTDIGYASHGDAAGIAMAHIPEVIEVNGELKPYIVFDFLLRVKPAGGQQLMLDDLRQVIYEMRDTRKFKIALVSYDGFESQDSQQILAKKRFNTAEISVDRSKGPYEDLRQAIYERRIEFPEYITYLNNVDPDPVNIAFKELSELSDTGRKIDHPPKGSKDLADAMAGCVYALMANDQFRRGAKKPFKVQTNEEDMPDVFGSRKKVDGEYFGQEADADTLAIIQGTHGLPAIGLNPFAGLRRPATFG